MDFTDKPVSEKTAREKLMQLLGRAAIAVGITGVFGLIGLVMFS